MINASSLACKLFLFAFFFLSIAIFLILREVTFTPIYHIYKVVHALIPAFFLAASLFWRISRSQLSTDDYSLKELFKKLVFISLIFGVPWFIIEFIYFFNTCSGEDCLGIIVFPYLPPVFIGAIFIFNLLLFYLLQREPLRYFLFVAVIIVHGIFAWLTFTNWDSRCSLPGVNKFSCLEAKALETKNYLICKKQIGEAGEVQCFEQVALKAEDPRICREYLKDFRRDYCLGSLARKTANPSFCEEIIDTQHRNICTSHFNLENYKEYGSFSVLHPDLLPLYAKFQWREPRQGTFYYPFIESLTPKNLSGYRVSTFGSAVLPEDVKMFREFYDDKLRKLGWEEDPNISARNLAPRGSIWGYRKESDYVIFSEDISKTTNIEDRGGIYIFSAQNQN